MKKVAIVFDHPYGMEAGYNEPHKRSFTSALLVALLKAMEDDGTEVDLIDLHKDNFNPVMSKQRLNKLAELNLLLIHKVRIILNAYKWLMKSLCYFQYGGKLCLQ